jgi:hypothetical protein
MSRFAPVGRGRGKLMVAAKPGRPLVTADASDDRVEALCAAPLQEPDARLPGARQQHLAHRSARDVPEVYEVLMQIHKTRVLKARFLGNFSGVLPQDHSWATMRHWRFHLVATAITSA